MGYDAPAADVDPYAAMHIRHKAKQLIGRNGFTRNDLEDIRQELTLDHLKRRDQFDPKRSSLHTFIVRIVRHKIASMIEHREAGVRDYRREECSLDEPVVDADGHGVERHETVDGEADRPGLSAHERHQLRLDLERVFLGLPEDLKPVCRLLWAEKTISEVSRELGIARSTVYERIKRLRSRFEDARLGDYLEKS